MPKDFVAAQRDAQAEFFARTSPANAIRSTEAWRLVQGNRLLNLSPSIRSAMDAYFGAPRNIAWHQHADHGLSSQVCCLNFLGPLANQPELLSKVIGGALGISPPKMLPIEEEQKVLGLSDLNGSVPQIIWTNGIKRRGRVLAEPT